MKFPITSINNSLIKHRLRYLFIVALLSSQLIACISGSQINPGATHPSGGTSSAATPTAQLAPLAEATATAIYLPTLANNATSKPILLGVYANTLEELRGMDKWITGSPDGRNTSIVQIFPKFENAFPARLEEFWANGYVTFINLTESTYTMQQILDGALNPQIDAWAQSYKAWVDKGGDRFAFIALFQEMNGGWRKYSENLTPDLFKQGYQYVQDRFYAAGVPRASIRWVFAPNGWSTVENKFENYYPGDDKIDVVGFSSYNYGFCVNNANYLPVWLTPEQVYNPPNNPAKPDEIFRYLDRIRAMAPTKPVFLIETGTSDEYATNGVADRAQKDQWLASAYAYLAEQPQVRAVLYFNTTETDQAKGIQCDYRVYDFGGKTENFEGYRTAVLKSDYGYISPADLAHLDLSPK